MKDHGFLGADFFLQSCFYIFFLQALLAMYLLSVVYLVRRKLLMVNEEEGEGIVKVVMIDGRGKTKLRDVENVLNDENKILL